MRGRMNWMHMTVGLITLAVAVLAPVGEDRTVSGATEQIIGTIVRVSHQAPMPELQTGQIGERYDESMSVDGRTLRFAANVMFSDDAGNERRWSDFQRDDFVLFHSDGFHVDTVVLLLPR